MIVGAMANCVRACVGKGYINRIIISMAANYRYTVVVIFGWHKYLFWTPLIVGRFLD